MWSVLLSGKYRSYDSNINDEIERAHAGGDAQAVVRVRGSDYVLTFEPADQMKQTLRADPTKVRPIRREPVSSSSSSPAAPAPAPTPAPAPAPAPKRKEADAGEWTKASAPRLDSPLAPPARAVIVFAPGAGGVTAKQMSALQDGPLLHRGVVCVRCDSYATAPGENRWTTTSPASRGNLAHVVSVAARAAAAHPDVPIFLAGASFGCRVLAELLSAPEAAKLPASVRRDALICAGYPLHKLKAPEGADPKRAATLLRLPSTVTTLFVQGSDDDFLGPRGLEALRDVIGRMAGEATLVALEGGEHTVPKAKRLRQQGLSQRDVDDKVVDAIVRFTST